MLPFPIHFSFVPRQRQLESETVNNIFNVTSNFKQTRVAEKQLNEQQQNTLEKLGNLRERCLMEIEEKYRNNKGIC